MGRADTTAGEQGRRVTHVCVVLLEHSPLLSVQLPAERLTAAPLAAKQLVLALQVWIQVLRLCH